MLAPIPSRSSCVKAERKEWLITWAFRLGFTLVALLSIYVFVFGS